MASIERSVVATDQFALSEVGDSPDNAYLKNLLLLGKTAAAFGSWLELSDYFASKQINSPGYPQRGFAVDVHFLINPHPIYRIQNHAYPYLVLTKVGYRDGRLTGGYSDHVPVKSIFIVLKGDGLISLTVWNYSGSRQEYEGALRYTEPPKLTRKVEGVTERVQMKFVSECYVNITAYPGVICPEAKNLLNRITQEAVEEFLGMDFQLQPTTTPEQKLPHWYSRFNLLRRFQR